MKISYGKSMRHVGVVKKQNINFMFYCMIYV